MVRQDEVVNSATFSYIDDIVINKGICTTVNVKANLKWFGLTSKDPEPLTNGAHVLGLHIWEEHRRLQWRHEGRLPMAPNVCTHWSIVSLCGKLTGHLPVCGWLHVRCSASAVTTGWDEVQDFLLHQMWRCPWCSRYRRRKWTRRHEFKSWTRLIAFSHSTNTLGEGMNPNILPPAMGK